MDKTLYKFNNLGQWSVNKSEPDTVQNREQRIANVKSKLQEFLTTVKSKDLISNDVNNPSNTMSTKQEELLSNLSMAESASSSVATVSTPEGWVGGNTAMMAEKNEPQVALKISSEKLPKKNKAAQLKERELNKPEKLHLQNDDEDFDMATNTFKHKNQDSKL